MTDHDHEQERQLHNAGATIAAAALAYWYSTMSGTKATHVFAVFVGLDIVYSIFVLYIFGRRER